ncbi:hypothetical protein B296_00029210 [Ensete ventricosum]|uniref:Uncharacterized protein n=1 Tax=Ensete ventricosum TaxID=4639 RepID=A0A426Y100_ENSVE|nr:hypothetical protein B296_00029210 [Ensete ventricosum]
MMGQDQAWASGRSSDDAVGPRQEFVRRFVEGIRKLAGNTLGDCWKKTVRFIARMPEATELGGTGKSMRHTIGQMWIFLYDLLLVLEVLLFMFRIINGFNQKKSSPLAAMVMAPWLHDRPILNSKNMAHSLSSMRDSNASNLASIRSSNAIAYCGSLLIGLRFTLLFRLAVNLRNMIRQLCLKELLGWLDEDDGWLWKGNEAPRNVALIPSVRTLADSKLGVDLYREFDPPGTR